MDKVVGTCENDYGSRFVGYHVLCKPRIYIGSDISVFPFIDDSIAGGLPPQAGKALAAPVGKSVDDAVSDTYNFHVTR